MGYWWDYGENIAMVSIDTMVTVDTSRNIVIYSTAQIWSTLFRQNGRHFANVISCSVKDASNSRHHNKIHNPGFTRDHRYSINLISYCTQQYILCNEIHRCVLSFSSCFQLFQTFTSTVEYIFQLVSNSNPYFQEYTVSVISTIKSLIHYWWHCQTIAQPYSCNVSASYSHLP